MADVDRAAPDPSADDHDGTPRTTPVGPPVVGLGASAGGLEALRAFFGALPSESGMAFVVVMHLDPARESALATLLQPYTAMPVRQVTGRTALAPNQVYVIPPGWEIVVGDSYLTLAEFQEPRELRRPIDHFFRSLAESRSGRAAIILSGGGTDGSVGGKAIKEAGGLLLVQEPDEAEHDGMPQAALATGIADIVLPAADLARALVDYYDDVGERLVSEALTEQEEALLRSILAQLQMHTSHDFSEYKRSTVLRRLQRRMQLRNQRTLQEYLHLLRTTPGEAQELFRELLIGVTNFFRDPEAWEALRCEVIPRLFEEKVAGETVRVWTVGCSTGEEAYSLAMLLMESASEVMARSGMKVNLQVFASDLDDLSLQKAREGLYPSAIEADVSPERLERFFIKQRDYYQVRRELRDIVLFTEHSVLRDPPFSHLDLITCRNLLIYMQRPLQQNVFDIFHYALNPGGYLFLGSAETADVVADRFSAVDRGQRIYQGQMIAGRPPRIPLAPLVQRRGSLPAAPLVREPRPAPRVWAEPDPATVEGLHRQALEQVNPPSALVDESYQILHLSETVGRYLQHPGGQVTNDLLRLVRPELQASLQIALFRAFQQGKMVVSAPIPVTFNGHPHNVTLAVRPQPAALHEGREGRWALVFFLEDEPEEPGPLLLETRDADNLLAGGRTELVGPLQAQVRYLRQELQVRTEEYEASVEELKAANEELQSINEEYRSATEELETSKEELQSLNEELSTVNAALKIKLDEISRAHSDLENLMGATQIATLFLDRELRIQRFTHGVQELLNIMAGDRGRSISHLTRKLDYPRLEEDAQQVLRSLVPIEREATGQDGRWFMVRLVPYRTVDDRIEGVVVTFVEITERRRNEMALHESEEKYRQLFSAMDQAYTVVEVIRDEHGRCVDLLHLEANPAYAAHTGMPDVAGHTLTELLGSPNPRWAEIFGWVADTGEAVRFQEYEPVLGRLFDLNLFRLGGPGSRQVASLFTDITERRRNEEALRESEERFRALVTASAYAIYRMSPDWSEMWQLGGQGTVAESESLNDSWLGEYIHPDDQTAVTQAIQGAIEERRLFELEYRVRRRDGTVGWTLSRAVPLFDEQGEIVEWFGAASDVTARKQAELALRESETRFRALADLVPDLIWRSDPSGYRTWYNRRWVEYTGQMGEEGQGWGWTQAIHPEDRVRSRAAYQRAMEGGQPLVQEYRLRAADGGYRWFLVRAEPVHDEEGEIKQWIGAATDIHEQRLAMETLEARVRERTAQVEKLAASLTFAEQEERQRISQILHDDLQQRLYSLLLRTRTLARVAEASPEVESTVEQFRQQLQEAVNVTRKLVTELNPPILENEGLPEALQWLARHIEEMYGLNVEIEARTTRRPASKVVQNLLIQMARELLFNTVKHAGAPGARVVLEQVGEQLHLRIEDEGKGFDVEAALERSASGGSFGLHSIVQRLRLIGGDVRVESVPDEGSAVTLIVPAGAAGETTNTAD